MSHTVTQQIEYPPVKLPHNIFIERHFAPGTREYVLRRPSISPTNLYVQRGMIIILLTISMIFCLLQAQDTMWNFSMTMFFRWRILIPFILAFFLFRSERKQIVENSLLVMRGLGIQIETKRVDGSTSRKFFDRHNIRATIVNEGYRLGTICFYNAFMLEQQDSLTLAFSSEIPPIPIVAHVYSGLQHLLFNAPDIMPITQSDFDEQYITAADVAKPGRRHTREADQIRLYG